MIAMLTILISRYKDEVLEEPQFAGETFEDRKARVLATNFGITLTYVPFKQNPSWTYSNTALSRFSSGLSAFRWSSKGESNSHSRVSCEKYKNYKCTNTYMRRGYRNCVSYKIECTDEVANVHNHVHAIAAEMDIIIVF